MGFLFESIRKFPTRAAAWSLTLSAVSLDSHCIQPNRFLRRRIGSVRASLCRACVVIVAFGMALQASSQQKSVIFLPHKSPATPQGAEGGFWRIDSNFEPILHLKNELLKTPLTVTPMLYMADGTEYDLPVVSLETAGVASVNIRDAVEALPPAAAAHLSDYGAVGIKYQWSWPAVLATVQNIDQIQSLTFISSLPTDITAIASTAATASQRIDGVWWRPTPNVQGFLVLFNGAAAPQAATVQFTDSVGNSISQQAVQLAPHQSVRLSLQSAFGATTSQTGGIAIQYQGAALSLLAFGGLEDAATGYSATLHLYEYHPELAQNTSPHQITLDAPGILSGSQPAEMQFPAGTVFAPYCVVHNVGTAARTVQLALT